MNTFILASAVFALAFGQNLDLNENSLAPTFMDKAASVGLAQPTSPAIFIETSQEGVYLEAHPTTVTEGIENVEATTVADYVPGQTGGVLNVMGGAAEGDLHGANPRQNLVYFGVGRHGFGIGAECDGCIPGCGSCKGDSNRNAHPHRNAQPCAEPQHNADPCDPNRNAQPYLKVTPTMNVQAHTRTHVETRTSAIYDVHTSYQTRTITDEIKSTSTEWVHPEQTYTYVEYQTVYEYPAATIDAGDVRRPRETDCNHNTGRNHEHSNNGEKCGGCGSCIHNCHC